MSSRKKFLKRFVLFAPSINEGGGLNMLRCLLSTAENSISYFILDSRIEDTLNLKSKGNVYYAKVGLIGRFQAEYHLRKIVSEYDKILCLGNLPPFFKLKSVNIYLFMQNRLMLDKEGCKSLAVKLALRIRIQAYWLQLHANKVIKFFVQTKSMRSLLYDMLGENIVVELIALSDNCKILPRKIVKIDEVKDKRTNFVYVASALGHKNHLKLIRAWIILAQQNIYPELRLTIERQQNPSLYSFYESVKRKYKLNIHNVGSVSAKTVEKLYCESSALIYPSLVESFGLPLVEAREHGLPIIASELDFVRDLVDPEESFDPNSAQSIARAVKRFMGIFEEEVQLLDGYHFVNMILAE